MQQFKHILFYLQSLLGEAFSLLIALLSYPFPDRKIDTSREGPGVLCIHGYVHNTSPWRWFRYALQKRGIGPVNTVYYPSLLEDISAASHHIKEKIAFLEKTGQSVDLLIGHSEGGLVALEYALEHAPKGKTIFIIALGAPLQGTWLAKIALGPAGKQMLPRSAYLESLKKRLQTAHHIRFLALSSRVDGIIRPPENSIWKDFPHRTFDNLGHVQFLFSPKVVDACVAFLKEQK